MDFHSLKRKELQALCKKHGIPANLTNREMADRLASNFKENEDLVSSSTSPVEICSENEAKVGKKQSKKVRFSPESDSQTFEYEVSVYQKPKRATRHTLSKNPAQVLENAPKSQLRVTRSRVQSPVKEDINTASSPPIEDIKNLEGCQLRVTRSRVQNAVKEDINMVSSPPTEDIKILEGCQLRVTRSRVQNAVKEDLNTVSLPPVGRKRIGGGKKSKDVEEVDDIGDSESIEPGKKGDVKNDTGGLRGRQLRSRKIATVTQEDAKKLRNGKGGDEVHLLDESSEAKSAPKQHSTRNVEVVSRVTRQSRAQSKDMASMVNNEVKIVGVKEGCEAEKPQRRSKRAISVTSQHQAPLRRGRRKTVILGAPAPELENQDDIGKDTTEEQRKSSRNSSRHSLSGTFKEDPIAISENDLRGKHQTQEPILEEEKTSAREHHPPTQKPQRRSCRNNSISASVAPPTPVKVVENEQQSKSTMAIVEEEAAPTDSLSSPGQLPIGKDILVAVSEHAGNEYSLAVHVSKQVVKNSDTCSKKSRKGLRRNSGVKLVGPSTDLELKQSAHGSVAVYGKESNFVVDATEKFVPGGNTESEVTCMSSQTVNTICVPDAANFSDPKRLKFESYSSHVVDSSQIYFPYGNHGKGVFDQGMKEDMKLTDTHYAHESLTVYKEDITLVESEKEMVVQVDAAGSEMDHHSSSWSLQQRGAVSESNRVKSRQVEFQSNVINMDEITCRADGLSDQRDLTGATSTYLQSEEELGTELEGGENTSFASDNVTAADRTPFAEAHIGVDLKDTEVTAAESVKEEVFNLNKFGEISGVKIELENPLKKAEEIIFTDASRESTPQIQSSVEAAENQESSAKSHFATVEVETQNISVNQQSLYSNSVAPGTPCEPVPGNQFEDKCRAEAADTAGRTIFDQKRSEDLNPGKAPCIHESVLMYEESPGLVKNGEEIRIHDEYIESESSPSLNRTGAVENSNLVESRMVDFGSSGSKVVSPVVVSLADIFSSATQGDHGDKSSSRMELDKVLETQEPSEFTKAISYNMDTEGIRNSVPQDQQRSEDSGPGSAPCFTESVFMYEENTTRLVKNDEEIRMHDGYIESDCSPSLNSTGAVDDSNLAESKMDDSGSSCTKAVSPETVSLAHIFSSARQRDHAGKSSSRTQLEKVLEEPSKNIKSISYDDMDAEGIRTPVTEDQQRSEDPNPGNTPCIQKSVLLYEENTTRLVKNDEEIRIHDGYIESERTPSLNRTGAVIDSNLVEPRMDDSGSSCTEVVTPETVSLAHIFSSASQGDHAGTSSSCMQLEKVLEEPSENIKSISYDMDAEGIRTPVLEDQQRSEDPNPGNAPCIQESVLMYEENTTRFVKNNEDIRTHDYFESESSPSLNKTGAVYDSNLVEPRMDDSGSSCTKVVSPETVSLACIFSSASQGNHAGKSSSPMQLEKVLEEPSKNIKSISYDDMDAEGIRTPVTEDQQRSEDPNPGNTPCIQESVLLYEVTTTRLVKNDEEIRIHDGYIESERTPSLNRTGAVVDSNLVEPRMDDSGSSCTNVVSPETVSLAHIFSSASQGDHAGKSSSCMQLEKVLEEPSKNIKSISYDDMDAEGIRTPVTEDQQRSEDPNPGNAPCIQESVLMYEENTTRFVKNNEDIRIHDDYFESESSLSLNRTGAVDDSNLVEPRMDDSGSSCTKVVSPETVSLARIFSSASQGDHAGKSSSPMQLEKVSEEPSESMKSISYNIDAEGIRTPVPEDQQRSEDTGPGSAPCFTEYVFMYEENTTTLVKNDEEIRIHDRYTESDCFPSLNRTCAIDDSNLVESIIDDSGSSCTKVVSPETVSLAHIFSSASQGDRADKSSSPMQLEKVLEEPSNIKSAEGIRTPVPEDQQRSEDPNPGNAPCIQESVFMYEENTARLVKNNEDIRIHDDYFESESSPSLNRTSAVDDSNLVEPRMDDSGRSCTKVVSPETVSLARIFSFASLGDHAGKSSSHMGLKKVLKTQEPFGNMKSMIYNLDAAGIRTSVPEDQTNFAGICKEKLPYSSCLPAINDTQEKSEAICMDIKNTRIETPVSAGNFSQALPPENLTAPIISEAFSMSPLDHALVDGEGNASGERVMDHPFSIDFVATMDGKGIIEGRETDGVEEDNIVEEIPSALKRELTDYRGGEVDAELYHTDMSDTKTIFQETDTFAAKQLDSAFANDVGVEDGEKASNSHQGSLHGDEQEEISSFTDKPCSKLEIGIGSSTLLCSSFPAKKKEHPLAMDVINHVGGTEISSECKEQQLLDELNFFTNTEMSLFWGNNDEVKETDAKAGDSNDADNAITECNSSEIKEGDNVAITDAEDTNFSVKKDGPEDTKETMGLREDFQGQDAAMADKSPLLKSSEADRVVDGEAVAAFRTELDLLNGNAKKETSNSVSVKQLISSIRKSKSNSRLIQRTPKRKIIHDMKENEGGGTKRAEIGNKKTTPKALSKLRRPLEHI